MSNYVVFNELDRQELMRFYHKYYSNSISYSNSAKWVMYSDRYDTDIQPPNKKTIEELKRDLL